VTDEDRVPSLIDRHADVFLSRIQAEVWPSNREPGCSLCILHPLLVTIVLHVYSSQARRSRQCEPFICDLLKLAMKSSMVHQR
jgi:hypothetical protein